jgi:ureidoglycolate hydrolase
VPHPRAVELKLEPLTHDAWTPFGAIPSDEGSEHDTAALEFLWNDGTVNFIEHHTGEIRVSRDRRARCDHLNRHDTHTQTLMPCDTDGFLVVAPADVDFTHEAHFATVRAFLVPRLQPVHLARGTWHWGPYPVEGTSIRVFNVQGRGYPMDNTVAHLGDDFGVVFDVVLDVAP